MNTLLTIDEAAYFPTEPEPETPIAKLLQEIELARQAVIAPPQIEPWPRPFEIHSTPRLWPLPVS